MSNKNKSISARARFSSLLAFVLAALLTPAGKIVATAVAGAAIIGGLSLAPQKPVSQKVALQEPKPQILPVAMPPLNDAHETLTIETDSGPLALVLGDHAEPPTGVAPGSPGPDPSGPGLPQGTRPGPGAPDLPSGPNGCVPGVDCPPPGPPPGPPGPQTPPPEDPSPQNPEDRRPIAPPQGELPDACTPGVDCTKGKPDESESESCTPGIDCPENNPVQPCKPGDCPPQVRPACPPGVDCKAIPPGCVPGVDCVPEGDLPCMPGVDCDLSCAPGEVCIPPPELLPVAGAEEPDLPATEAPRTAAVPEPATFALVMLGLFALAWMLRRNPATQPKPD